MKLYNIRDLCNEDKNLTLKELLKLTDFDDEEVDTIASLRDGEVCALTTEISIRRTT